MSPQKHPKHFQIDDKISHQYPKGAKMASDQSFVDYVVEQVRDAGLISAKKMFGEYCLYSDGKPIGLICQNTLYIKKLPVMDELLAGCECDSPYDGAREHYVVDPDESELLSEAVRLAASVTAVPKPRKR
jgi:TfoX/Sxy family transcriptional regulator of competence genes